MGKKPPVKKSGHNAQLTESSRTDEDPLIRKLEAQARYASPTARAGIAGAIMLRRGLLRVLEHETESQSPSTVKIPPERLVLKFHGEKDKEAYRRLIASAQDEPRSATPMGPSNRERAKRRKAKPSK